MRRGSGSSPCSTARRREGRAWLAENHARDSGIWLVTYKNASGKPRVTWDEIVEEALSFVWIDSRPGTVNEERTKLWLAPRRDSQGRRFLGGARRGGGRDRPSRPEAGVGDGPSRGGGMESFSLSARKGILQWIAGAKRPETRAKRVTETVELASRGLNANQWPRQG